MPNFHAQYRSTSGSIDAFRLGRVLLIIGLCCGAPIVQAQTSDLATSDQPENSWTATTGLQSGDLLPTRIPVRISEHHEQNGNRTFEERSVQIQGMDGRLTPYQEIEKETLQVDATTVRTTIRTFGRDINGAKSLIQVTEEESHTLPSGESSVRRITFNPDVNGKLEPVQREIVETKTISKDVQETNRMVMLTNINGGLAPAVKTQEIRRRLADGTSESQKNTLSADGGGKWELRETRQVTTRQEGPNLVTEERVLRPESEEKLVEISRVMSQESNSDSGQEHSIVETYSLDVPGVPQDGNLHLVERASSYSHRNANGGRSTEQTVEQPNPGDPGAGLRVYMLVNDEMVPVSSGEQSAVVIRVLDSNGSFDVVAVDTTRSDRIPTIQVQ